MPTLTRDCFLIQIGCVRAGKTQKCAGCGSLGLGTCVLDGPPLLRSPKFLAVPYWRNMMPGMGISSYRHQSVTEQNHLSW